MDMKLAQNFAAAMQTKRNLEEELRQVKASMSELEPLLLQEMRDNQTERFTMKVNDETMTLHLHSVLVAKPKVDRAEIAEVLEALDTGLVKKTYNANTLNAYVRELAANEEELPRQLASVLETDLITSIRGRRSVAQESKSAKAGRNLEETR